MFNGFFKILGWFLCQNFEEKHWKWTGWKVSRSVLRVVKNLCMCFQADEKYTKMKYIRIHWFINGISMTWCTSCLVYTLRNLGNRCSRSTKIQELLGIAWFMVTVVIRPIWSQFYHDLPWFYLLSNFVM